MFRLSLIESEARALPVSPGTVVSIVAHLVLVGGWVVATAPRAAESNAPASSWVRFLVPPDRIRSRAVQQERIEWAGIGGDAGRAPPTAVRNDQALETLRGAGPRPSDAGEEPQPVPEIASPQLSDVLTVLEVDSAVARDPMSTAPPYPADMLKLKIEGSASVQFVVDTTGVADTATFSVLAATHPSFAESVRQTLPAMRFRPAILQRHKVRQLVQQMFSFRIQDPPAATTAAGTKKPSGGA